MGRFAGWVNPDPGKGLTNERRIYSLSLPCVGASLGTNAVSGAGDWAAGAVFLFAILL